MESNGQSQAAHVFEFGLFRLDTLDTTDHRLLYKGQPYKIQNKQFCILCLLVTHHGVDFSSEQLIRELWPETYVEPDDQSKRAEECRRTNPGKVQAQIKLLRRAIGKDTIDSRKKGSYYFKEPVREIELPQAPSEVYADLKFDKWIIYPNEYWHIKVYLGAGVMLSLIYSLLYLLRNLIPYSGVVWPDPRVALSLIQFIVIGGALIASFFIFNRSSKEFPSSATADAALMQVCGYNDPEKWAEAKVGAQDSLQRYSRYWKYLLVAWSCLYLLLFFYFKHLNNRGDVFRVLSIGATFFNNFNSLAIALCFVVLNHPTVFREKEQNTSLTRITRIIERGGALTIILVALAEILLVVAHRTPWLSFISPDNIIGWLDVISGLIGGVTLALFVGRIQSKFLGPSTWLPLAFYLYVVIQALYVAIKAYAHWGAAIIEVALVLKCLLYLYIVWLFKSGRLLFYLVRVKTVYERVNVEWKDFLFNLDRE